jgi:hypothetical protein
VTVSLAVALWLGQFASSAARDAQQQPNLADQFAPTDFPIQLSSAVALYGLLL